MSDRPVFSHGLLWYFFILLAIQYVKFSEKVNSKLEIDLIEVNVFEN